MLDRNEIVMTEGRGYRGMGDMGLFLSVLAAAIVIFAGGAAGWIVSDTDRADAAVAAKDAATSAGEDGAAVVRHAAEPATLELAAEADGVALSATSSSATSAPADSQGR